MTVLGVPGHPLTVVAALVPKKRDRDRKSMENRKERERGRAFVSPAALRQVEFPMLLDPVPGKANTPPATHEKLLPRLLRRRSKNLRRARSVASRKPLLAARSTCSCFLRKSLALRLSSTMSLADPSCVPMSDLAVHGTSHELTTLHQQPQKAPSHRPIVG